MRLRRALLVLGVVLVGLAVTQGPASAQAVPLLTTAPFVVVPGGSATVSGPAVTCEGEQSSLFLEVPGLAAPRALAAGSPIEVVIPTTASTPAAIYDVEVTCFDYSGASTAAAKGWISVGTSDGLPPSSGTFSVSSYDLTWLDQCDVEAFGFAPETPVEVWMYSTPQLLGTFSASATGSLVGTVTMPPGTSLGSHTMALAGRDVTGRPLFLTVGITLGASASNVAPIPSTGGGTLPATGSDGQLALLGGGLLALGAAFVFTSRSLGRRASVG